MTKGEVMNIIKSVTVRVMARIRTRITDQVIDQAFNQVKDIVMTYIRAYEGVPKDGYKIARHKIGSTDNSKNWAKYWEEHHPSHHFPSEPHECPSCLLKKDDFVGGHVIIENKTYILPVCRECNSTYKNSNAHNHAFYVKMEEVVCAPED